MTRSPIELFWTAKKDFIKRFHNFPKQGPKREEECCYQAAALCTAGLNIDIDVPPPKTDSSVTL